MARMTGFVFQDEYLERLAKLSDQELGRLVRALSVYHSTGEAQELAGRESIAYDFIRADIDRIDGRYAEKCEQNRINRQQALTTVNDRQRPSTKSNERDKDKDKDKDKEKVKVNTTEREAKTASRFTPPTLGEVVAYCMERKNGLDAETFIDFYSSKGWRIGNSPMKDWKAAVRTWEKRDSKPEQKPKKILNAQDYQQRTYTADDINSMTRALMEEAMNA